MSEDHRPPLLPQLLILLREDEEQVEGETVEETCAEAPREPRAPYGLAPRAPFRKAG